MRIAEMFRQHASMSGLSLREYEALILYGVDGMRFQLTYGGAEPRVAEDASNRDVVREYGRSMMVGSCGVTANELANILLGRDLGEALSTAANQTASQGGGDAYETNALGGVRSCTGRGIAALRTALEGYFASDDALCVVHLRGLHRFLAIKEGDAIEVLQTWFDAPRSLGYTLADWLEAGNTRVGHPVGEFLDLLEAALNGDADRARELFQPVTGPSLPADNLEFGGKEVSFAAVLMDTTAMSQRFIVHQQQRLTQLA